MNLSILLHRALDDSRTVSFIYDGKQRTVEVHAFSDTLMRGYQVAGESSRPLPCWALFKTDKITGLTLSAFCDSEAPRPGFALNDKQIPHILGQLKLAA